MEACVRPWFSAGVALVSASAIALAPIAPATPSGPALDAPRVAAAVSRDFQLSAFEIPYILTLPIVRQNISNEIQNWAVYLGGIAESGVGLAQSLLSIPGVTVQVIQQALALNFVGAFDTVTSAVGNSVIAVGQPLLESVIWRNQRAALVQAALQVAGPQAYIALANGFLVAANGVGTSLIVGTQNLVAAIISLNLANIVNAALGGTQNFVQALGQGADSIVGGIEAAQRGIVAALATQPPPSPFAGVTDAPATVAPDAPAAGIADVSAMQTLAVGSTVSLARVAKTVAPDPVAPEAEQVASGTEVVGTAPDPAETVSVAKEADPSPQDEKTPVKVEPTDTSQSPATTSAKTTASAASTDETTPADPPKTSSKDVTVKDVPKKADEDSGVAKVGGVTKDAGAKSDAGADAKSTSGADASSS